MELRRKISDQIRTLVKELFEVDVEIELTIPEVKFGDFSTNVAMQIAGRVGASPRDIADKLSAKLIDNGIRAEVAGPGFINIWTSDADLVRVIDKVSEQGNEYGKSDIYKGKVVVAEYSDLNAFKTAHAGHLYTTLVGDAVANLFEYAGATVHRVNFGGDVGLHVGRAMWSIMREVKDDIKALDRIDPQARSAWISAHYVSGNAAYEADIDGAKDEIIETNKRCYKIHADNDHESIFAQVYWQCRQWSYDGFELFYKSLQIAAPKEEGGLYFHYYPESATAPYGEKLVRSGLDKGIFEMSDGAVIYRGEKDGLHTRVFLNSVGLPTYEAKDLGLAVKKWDDYKFDLSYMITGNEIKEYMKVVLAALSHFHPEIAERTVHLTHGMILLEGGEKMSSRKGTVVLPSEVIESAEIANRAVSGKDQPLTVLAAIKYAFLKQRIGGDIVYSATDSVSAIGNSGPYLQYSHARAMSIQSKSTKKAAASMGSISEGERQLVKKIAEYPTVIAHAVTDLMPHHICSYLYELAQEFNKFYERMKVVGDPRESERLLLVTAYSQVLRNGLSLLGIYAPDKM